MSNKNTNIQTRVLSFLQGLYTFDIRKMRDKNACIIKAESLDETATWRMKMPSHYGKKKKTGKKKKKSNGLTAKQRKLPMALQKAILRRKRGKK